MSLEIQILSIIEASFEDTRVPCAIAAHADKRVGKLVTKTDAAQLEAQLGIPVYLRRQHGMTYIAWTLREGASCREQSMLLGHSESNLRWPSGDELRSKAPAYFEARDERNTARNKLLAEHLQRGRIPAVNPSHIERAAAAILKLREAREALSKLLDYGQPMNAIRYAIEELAEAK